METRLADVRLWADGVGAMAQGPASLDQRFHSRPQDLFLVKTILIMLADFVKDYSEGQTADEVVERIDSAIENLALIGVAIRRTGKASRRRREDAQFDRQDYGELRRHLECIILLRPSKAGLETELNPSTLSIVQERLIEANLKRRHRFVFAQNRSRKLGTRGTHQSTDDHVLQQDELFGGEGKGEASPAKTRSTQGAQPPAPPTRGGLTIASTAEGTLQYGGNGRYVSGAARTQITALAADTEFPKPPRTLEDRHIGKCPCCCQSIPTKEMDDPIKWRSDSHSF